MKNRNINSKTNDIVLTGLFTALVFLATLMINIRLPIAIHGGLIHLGTAVVVVLAIVTDARKAGVSAALGMSLFDVVTGGVVWAPFTFVIKGSMGYIINKIAYYRGRNGENLFWNTLAVAAAGVWMIIGYYIAEGIIYGNWIAPVTSIPGMVLQIAAAAVFGIPLAAVLKKTGFAK